MAKTGSNPQFLNVDKKVVYNIRLPQRLIDKINAYAELTGNTTTNIVTNVLSDFVADKVVLNDYLDNVGGVTVKIPYAINQKNNFINDCWNLIDYNSDDTLTYHVVDSVYSETYFAELFEVKKIPNNLDIYDGDSYAANKSILKFNHNAIHSGIELFIYNITEIIFTDKETLNGKTDSFVNCLYCLYFEVAESGDVSVYLIDYLTAINLLSASGNDKYKDLIIAAATELSDVDNVVTSYNDDFVNGELKIAEKYLSGETTDDETYAAYEKEVAELETKINAECKAKCDELVNVIADGYNSNNIIIFGTDIFSRLAVKEIKVAADIDDIINAKIDAIFDEKIGELEKSNADMNAKLDAINNAIQNELNKNQ